MMYFLPLGLVTAIILIMDGASTIVLGGYILVKLKMILYGCGKKGGAGYGQEQIYGMKKAQVIFSGQINRHGFFGMKVPLITNLELTILRQSNGQIFKSKLYGYPSFPDF